MDSYFSTLFIEEIWPAYASGFKSCTRASYLSFIRSLCTYCQCDFMDVTVQQAQDFFDELSERERPLGTKSLHTMLSCYVGLAGFIETHAERFGLSGYRSPFDGIILEDYSDELHLSDLPNLRQIDHILKIAKQTDRTVYLALTLALRCGLTASEIINMKISQIKAFENGEGAVQIFSSQLVRDVKIPKDVMDLLISFCYGKPLSGYIFLNSRGGRLSVRSLQKAVRQVMLASGLLRTYTLQDFRNCCISLMLDGGADPGEVAEYTGISTRWLYRYPADVVSSTAPCDYSQIKVVS